MLSAGHYYQFLTLPFILSFVFAHFTLNMDSMIAGASWTLVFYVIALYLLALASYRLLLHPLAHFPEPKFAALTRYVEAYYDVVCNGQYTFKIQEMHRKYGK
jgi:hypothetical protein